MVRILAYVFPQVVRWRNARQLLQPRKTRPYILKDCLCDVKKQIKQTNTTDDSRSRLPLVQY